MFSLLLPVTMILLCLLSNFCKHFLIYFSHFPFVYSGSAGPASISSSWPKASLTYWIQFIMINFLCCSPLSFRSRHFLLESLLWLLSSTENLVRILLYVLFRVHNTYSLCSMYPTLSYMPVIFLFTSHKEYMFHILS